MATGKSLMALRRFGVGMLVAGTVALGGMTAFHSAPSGAAIPTVHAAEALGNGVSVSGEGRVQAAPDVAWVNVGVQTQGATAAEAMGKNGEAMTAVVNKVKELGIADTDIQTSDINLYPQYDNKREPDGTPPVVTGYQASTSIRITVNDISKAVWVLDGAVQAGANQANGLQFGIKDAAPQRQQALTRATQEARSRADAIASGLGLRVVGVRSATDSYSSPPTPVGRGGDSFAGAAPVAAPVPVERGQLTITERVNVVFDVAP